MYMNLVFQEIENIINDELNKINQKIKGTAYLEILKFKLLERLNLYNNINDLNFNGKDSHKFQQLNIEKEIYADLKLYTLPKVTLNKKLEYDTLILCVTGLVKIDLNESITKKLFNFFISTNNGICLTKGENFNLNIDKNSLIVEIYQIDNETDIENKSENTI